MKNLSLNSLLLFLTNNRSDFFNYLKSKFPLFHNSNFFFRDLHYGIKSFFEKKGIILSYSDSEKLALLFSDKLIEQNIFLRISDNTWKLNDLNYVTKEAGDPFRTIQLGGN
jgi:DNA-directed RNA polymerase delta subunit